MDKQVLIDLASKLGTTVELLYSVLVKQAYVVGVYSSIGALILLVVFILKRVGM